MLQQRRAVPIAVPFLLSRICKSLTTPSRLQRYLTYSRPTPALCHSPNARPLRQLPPLPTLRELPSFGTFRSYGGAIFHSESEVLRRLLEKSQKFYRSVYVVGGVLLALGGIILIKWDVIRREMGYEGARVIQEGIIKNNQIQLSAAEFSRALLIELMRDKKLADKFSQWMVSLLSNNEAPLADAVASIVKSEVVFNELCAVGRRLMKTLFQEKGAIEEVAKLISKAIDTEETKQATAEGLVEVLDKLMIKNKIIQIMQRNLLENQEINRELTELLGRILSDQQTIDVTKTHLNAILSNPQFQEKASEILWSLLKRAVAPRWFSTAARQVIRKAEEEEVESEDAKSKAAAEEKENDHTPPNITNI